MRLDSEIHRELLLQIIEKGTEHVTVPSRLWAEGLKLILAIREAPLEEAVGDHKDSQSAEDGLDEQRPAIAPV